MTKMIRKLISLCLAALVLCTLVTAAFAEDTAPDYSRRGSISVTVKDSVGHQVIPGGSLTLYTVARLVNGTEVYTDAFKDCGLALDNLESRRLVNGLAEYAKDNRISGMTVSISRLGGASFSNLPLGLYLIVQEEAAEGYGKLSPFLVTVPVVSEDELIYNVDASPKAGAPAPETEPTSSTTAPTSATTSPTTSTTSSTTASTTYSGSGSGAKLPQTGQKIWPVYVLAALGCGFILLGRRQLKKDD